eukprot:4451725-Prorocentrum_lima.AAC.1
MCSQDLVGRLKLKEHMVVERAKHVNEVLWQASPVEQATLRSELVNQERDALIIMTLGVQVG